MPYTALAFIAVLMFACVHLFAKKLHALSRPWQSFLLSAGSGVAIGYVFIDLLPKLSKSDQVVSKALMGFSPFLEKHSYILALCGFLLFYAVDRAHSFLQGKGALYFSLCSYALFNFLVGYAVVDQHNPEVRPLLLFTFAMAVHYLSNDYSLTREHGQLYSHYAKWLLIASLLLGWMVGLYTELPTAAVALVSAFIGGGVIMNVIRHELPAERPNSLAAFMLCALLYTFILLSIGS